MLQMRFISKAQNNIIIPLFVTRGKRHLCSTACSQACASHELSVGASLGAFCTRRDILVVCGSGVHRWDAELGLGSCDAANFSDYLERYR